VRGVLAARVESEGLHFLRADLGPPDLPLRINRRRVGRNPGQRRPVAAHCDGVCPCADVVDQFRGMVREWRRLNGLATGNTGHQFSLRIVTAQQTLPGSTYAGRRPPSSSVGEL
jgi:hypothetical protein